MICMTIYFILDKNKFCIYKLIPKGMFLLYLHLHVNIANEFV